MAGMRNTDDLATLHELNRNYVRSVLESDVRWFEANLAQDFMNSNPDGTLVDRAAFLRQVAAPCAVKDLREDDVVIHTLGEVAIIYARRPTASPTASPGRAATRMSGSCGRGAGSASRPTSAAAEAISL